MSDVNWNGKGHCRVETNQEVNEWGCYPLGILSNYKRCYRSNNTGSLYVCPSNLIKAITNRRQRYMPKTCLCYKSQFKDWGGWKC